MSKVFVWTVNKMEWLLSFSQKYLSLDKLSSSLSFANIVDLEIMKYNLQENSLIMELLFFSESFLNKTLIEMLSNLNIQQFISNRLTCKYLSMGRLKLVRLKDCYADLMMSWNSINLWEKFMNPKIMRSYKNSWQQSTSICKARDSPWQWR